MGLASSICFIALMRLTFRLPGVVTSKHMNQGKCFWCRIFLEEFIVRLFGLVQLITRSSIVILYGWDLGYHLKDKQRSRKFENMELGGMYSPKREEIAGGCSKSHDEKLHRVSGYRSRCSGFDSRCFQIF
jgi:hypothetical protein